MFFFLVDLYSLCKFYLWLHFILDSCVCLTILAIMVFLIADQFMKMKLLEDLNLEASRGAFIDLIYVISIYPNLG